MMHRTLTILCSFFVVLAALGCGGNVNNGSQPEETENPTLSNPPSEQPEPVVVTVPPATSNSQNELRPDGGNQEAQYINMIEFEHDPDEVAVPNGGMSDEVTANAWYLGDEYKKVPATWTWSVDDQVVAQMAFSPGSENLGTQWLTSNIDVFDSPDQKTEPYCELMACAVPVSAPPNTMDPVCGTLPVATVVNMIGTWSCQGTPDGDIAISQVGRWLTVNGTGQGTIYARIIDFYLGEYELRAELLDRNHMTGTYWKAGTSQVLGTWSAIRTP